MSNPLASAIAEIRVSRRLSGAGMQRATGVSRTLISRIESGDRLPSLGTLHQIVRGLDLTDEEMARLGRAVLTVRDPRRPHTAHVIRVTHRGETTA